MTSKEALESIIKNGLINSDLGELGFLEEIDTIKKDLEMLELLMAYIYDGFDYEYDSPAIKVIIEEFDNKDDYEKARLYIATHKKLDL